MTEDDLPLPVRTKIHRAASEFRELLVETALIAYRAGVAKATVVPAPALHIRPAPEDRPAPAKPAVLTGNGAKGSTVGLEPVTSVQAKIFETLERLTADGTIPSQNDIARAAGYSQGAYVINALEVLQRRGYVANIGQRGAPNWKTVVAGKIRVEESKFANAPADAPKQPIPAKWPADAPTVQAATPPPPETPPAPPEEKKHYPPVSTVARRVTPAPRAPISPPSSNAITQAAFGADGNGGRQAETGANGGIKVSTYLSRRGHTVFVTRNGWTIDGKFCDRYDAVDIINAYRRKADLSEASADELE